MALLDTLEDIQRMIETGTDDPAFGVVVRGNGNRVLRLPGRKIMLLRKRLRLTQEELAEKAGLTGSTIRAVEHEERLVRISTALKIAAVLEISPMKLHPCLPLFHDEPEEIRWGAPLKGRKLIDGDPTAVIVTRGDGSHVVLLPGRRVELLRIRARLTEKKLGEGAGLTEGAIKKIESEKRLVTVDTAIRIANILDVNPDKLHPALPVISPIELLLPKPSREVSIGEILPPPKV